MAISQPCLLLVWKNFHFVAMTVPSHTFTWTSLDLYDEYLGYVVVAEWTKFCTYVCNPKYCTPIFEFYFLRKPYFFDTEIIVVTSMTNWSLTRRRMEKHSRVPSRKVARSDEPTRLPHHMDTSYLVPFSQTSLILCAPQYISIQIPSDIYHHDPFLAIRGTFWSVERWWRNLLLSSRSPRGAQHRAQRKRCASGSFTFVSLSLSLIQHWKGSGVTLHEVNQDQHHDGTGREGTAMWWRDPPHSCGSIGFIDLLLAPHPPRY